MISIKETFTHRGIGFDDIVVFEPGFPEDTVRQNRWNSFIRKEKAMVKVDFTEAIEQSKRLLTPIVRNGKQVAVGYAPEIRTGWN